MTDCTRGHAALGWRHTSQQRPTPTSEPMEMMLAAGLMQVAQWYGYCSRCGAVVEWSTDKPGHASVRRQRRRGSFSPIRSRPRFQAGYK